jgi:hypothetical protein
MSPTRQELLATATAYCNAHNSRDLSAIRALCSTNCRHRGGPSSLKQPERTTDEYVAFNAEVFKLLHTYNAEITDAVVDPQTRKVSLFLHATATADAGTYENEYIITLTITEDGTKVQEQYDFIDSHVMVQWMAKMGSFADDTWEKK